MTVVEVALWGGRSEKGHQFFRGLQHAYRKQTLIVCYTMGGFPGSRSVQTIIPSGISDGWDKKWAGDERDKWRAGSTREKERLVANPLF